MLVNIIKPETKSNAEAKCSDIRKTIAFITKYNAINEITEEGIIPNNANIQNNNPAIKSKLPRILTIIF